MRRVADRADTPQARSDEVELLLAVLPDPLHRGLADVDRAALTEIVMDLGRPPAARIDGRTQTLSPEPVRAEDLAHVAERIGEFTEDNRAGIARTLHRIAALRNRKGQIVGLTLRVGRAVFGTIDTLRDLLESGRNLLILGRPGIGKTTKLREAARVLADDLSRRVVVIDTSNEIAGDGDVPHPAIGEARRMQVPHPQRQHAVMIEAVENHMPEVIVVDEIGTEAEAAAARTIAERGVQLIGTAHGNTLENLVMNPTLSDLVGGVHVVTLSDEEARRRGTPKTITERRAPPTFDVVVEIVERDEVIVHRDAAAAVDRLLEGLDPGGERRFQGRAAASPAVTNQSRVSMLTEPTTRGPAEQEKPIRIYPYALSRDLLERVIRDLRVNARTARRPEDADLVIALRSRADDTRLARLVDLTGLPLHVVKSNTTAQLRRALQSAFNVMQGLDDEEVKDAVREVEHAIQRVLNEGVEVALAPRRPTIRRMQHRMIARYHLDAEATGREPLKHLVIHPRG